ncbi:MAG TPA: tail fiber domain-containing protein [Thermoanaerobaculia bacterium]|nr:tail fiber domain-containing protein [Thermoanaerobaculia bacterium]
MKRTLQSTGWMAMLLLAAILLAPPVARAAAPLATVNVSPQGLEWQPAGDFEKFTLTVSGPGGVTLRRELQGGAALAFEPIGDDGKPLGDGTYAYELIASPRLDAQTRQALAAAHRAGNEAAIAKLQASGKVPGGSLAQSGFFTIHDGAIVPPDLKEGRPTTPRPTKALTPIALKDQVIPDDLIVQGSACIGLDCVNNESFGFDTIRLKENNTRIKFDDTSTGTGFPNHDWQLTANDSASGGANKFSIEDITASTVPFTVTGGATTNSIFVDSTGRVGFRTSTPVLDLHVNTSNTPAMRLEQNNSGGFTAQTWDVAGNEANFFVRDVTGGSRLPFRIRPGAPTSSIDINASGNVGIGTASPSTNLHVLSSGSGSTDGKVLVENTSGTNAAREMMELRNNGGTILILEDTSIVEKWSFGSFGTAFVIDNQAHTGVELTLGNTGNLVIQGTLTQGSSRDIKTGFAALDPKDVLSRVSALPVSQWSYKTESAVRHVGPMAEDFHQAFGLGEDDKHIAPGDQAGVALLAVQGLNQVVQQKDKEIAELKGRLEALEKLVQALYPPKAAVEPER